MGILKGIQGFTTKRRLFVMDCVEISVFTLVPNITRTNDSQTIVMSYRSNDISMENGGAGTHVSIITESIFKLF